MLINLLAVGDIVGKTGLEMCSRRLHSIKKNMNIDFTIVNGENASGIGITKSQAEQIFNAGADVITLGNHTWGRPEIADYLDDCQYILRPANFSPQTPGRGYNTYEASFGPIRVINLVGRCGMDFVPQNPFLEIENLLKTRDSVITVIDFHAEATSEMLAMAYYLDGRVAALWGTHTHVQTSDGAILPKGTGYITDLGMTGAKHSVIGIEPEQSIAMFRGDIRGKFMPAAGKSKMECAIFTIDTKTKRCTDVQALRIED